MPAQSTQEPAFKRRPEPVWAAFLLHHARGTSRAKQRSPDAPIPPQSTQDPAFKRRPEPVWAAFLLHHAEGGSGNCCNQALALIDPAAGVLSAIGIRSEEHTSEL